jgi:5-methylcytosine-specific restriction endonuclease McrA
MNRATHDKLRYAQELLSHQIHGGDIAMVVDRALDALIARLEKQKFAATDNPHSRQVRPKSARTIPTAVKRTVWERDGGRCTFVSESGLRCVSRACLEFDHVEPVARGGESTVDGVRLLCRAHNQYAAERVFGAGFMEHKRVEAKQARDQSARARTEIGLGMKETSEEVVPWLLKLGIRKDQARHAARLCDSIPNSPLEDRVRLALTCFGRGTKIMPSPASPPGP